MKKTTIFAFCAAVCLLLTCCGSQKFDDPEMQKNYETISAAMENKDWDGLVSDTDWYLMREEKAVSRLAAKKLTQYMKEDDLDSACQLLTSMNYDFIDGTEYCATYDFTSWVLNRFATDGSRFIKEEGAGGYYDTHSDELAEFVNYDEYTDTEYVSRVWYSGDFALNIYSSINRATGELTAPHSVGLYVAGTCVSLANNSTENINGEALLTGYMLNGSYYGLNGYILCNTGASCLESFILTDSSDGGYAIVRTAIEDYSGKQYKVG